MLLVDEKLGVRRIVRIVGFEEFVGFELISLESDGSDDSLESVDFCSLFLAPAFIVVS